VWWRIGAPVRWLQGLGKADGDTAASRLTFDANSAVPVPTKPLAQSRSPSSQFVDTSSISLQEFAAVQSSKSLSELLSRHDQSFVVSLYTTLLGREPDLEGMNFYLVRLRSGISKMEIIAEVTLSPEGSSYKPDLPGLDIELRRYKRRRLPLIGFIFRWIYRNPGSHASAQEIWAWENQISTFHEQHQSHLRQIVQAISEVNAKLDRQQRAQNASVSVTPSSESVGARESISASIPRGFHRSNSAETEIYFQLKSAIANRSVNESV
jgi:hypothetical protein